MGFRGSVAVVGIGETPHRRIWPGRTERGLCAEASAMAIADAGLRKEDIDGLITFGGQTSPGPMAEYIGIKPIHFAAGTSMMGCSSGVALTVAATVIHGGLAQNVLCTFGGGRDPAAGSGIYLGANPAPAGGRPDTGSRPAAVAPSAAARPSTPAAPAGGGARRTGGGNQATEFQAPYGPVVAANTGYGWLYTRHMYRYGTKPEQIALISARQRFNSLKNPLSAFGGQPITVQDVLNSRYVNEPLHILESVMPCAGATAFIVTSAEHAKSMPNKPVYLLGAGINQGSATNWVADDMTTVPARISAASAYEMAGYSAKDMQFAEFYD